MPVVEDDFGLVPLTGGLEVSLLEIGNVHGVVHGAALPGLEDIAVVHLGKVLIVNELILGTGDIGDSVLRAFHHMVEHAGVAALGNLPFPLEVEVLIDLVRDDVAVGVVTLAGGLDGAVLDDPGFAHEGGFVETAPSAEGGAVKEKFPAVGLFRRRKRVRFGGAADCKRGCRCQNNNPFHIDKQSNGHPWFSV